MVLLTQSFQRVVRLFGPFDIDLSASLLNAKCSAYVSWFPDPGSITVDAFTFSWRKLNFYAFPPFILLPRVLRKIADEEATGTLVIPWWPSQAWFPLFQRLLISAPIIFFPSQSLLSSPFRNHHPAWRSLSLAVGKVSAKLLKAA